MLNSYAGSMQAGLPPAIGMRGRVVVPENTTDEEIDQYSVEVTGPHPDLARKVWEITGRVSSRVVERKAREAKQELSFGTVNRMRQGQRVGADKIRAFANTYKCDVAPLLEAAGHTQIVRKVTRQVPPGLELVPADAVDRFLTVWEAAKSLEEQEALLSMMEAGRDLLLSRRDSTGKPQS